MNDDKMYLVNKLFDNENIRAVWDSDKEKYYISIVDVVGVLSGSVRPRKYWADLKKRLIEEGHSELSEKIGQLKLKSSDGKYYNTDVCDIKEMFRIIESIPSKNAEPIKQWLAHLGSERINEVFDPSISLQRAIDLYRSKGYDEKWIAKRIKGIQDRKELTDLWKEGGIKEGIEYAILTNEMYKTWSGMTAQEYKQYKGLRKENLRDHMDGLEASLTDISEEVTKRLANKRKPKGLDENIEVARRGSQVAKNTRDEIENLLGESVVTSFNNLGYEYKKGNELLEKK